ncbi:hypothetical protein ACFQT0_17775 [Hymenobacter humi]|uniref:Uncharacterized protein n=1 Tax=Hymenobacter humi TaxID=1411620 RepID=A0ABW2U694_9BACT
MSDIRGEQAIATILKHDNKTTSYKIALLRAINDVVLMYPDVARQGQPVAVPLSRLAELWVAYYWPFADAQLPIYQGARAIRDEATRNDIAFRPALTNLRAEWQHLVQLRPQPADGFFLLTEMRTPRRRATYPPALQHAYRQTVAATAKAIQMPIKYAGPGHWSVFDIPARYDQLPPRSCHCPVLSPRTHASWCRPACGRHSTGFHFTSKPFAFTNGACSPKASPKPTTARLLVATFTPCSPRAPITAARFRGSATRSTFCCTKTTISPAPGRKSASPSRSTMTSTTYCL